MAIPWKRPERARIESLQHQRLRGVVLDEDGDVAEPRQDLRRQLVEGRRRRAARTPPRAMRGLGPSLDWSRRRVASHSLTMPLESPFSSQATPSRWRASASSSGSSARAGEQLAQQARRLAGLAEIDVDLGRSQPGLGVVGVGLAPAAVRLERGLRVVLLARQRRFQLDDGRVVGGGFSRRAQRALHGAQVAVLERLPGVVEEALQFGVVSGLVGHAATVLRAGTRAQRGGGPSRCVSLAHSVDKVPPDPCIVTLIPAESSGAGKEGGSWRTSISPRDPRAKLREVTTKWTASMRVAGRAPNCGVVFGERRATGRRAADARGWLVGDRRPGADRRPLPDHGRRRRLAGPGRRVSGPDAAVAAWLAAPDDDLVTLLARALGDARLGGAGWLETAGGAERVDERRQRAAGPHDGPERGASRLTGARCKRAGSMVSARPL